MESTLKISKLKYGGGMVEQPTIGGRIANFTLLLVVLLLAFISIIPMWHVLMSSLSDGFSLLSFKGLVIFPVGQPTLEGYRLIFRDESVLTGYLNTVVYVLGTVGLGFVLNVLGGYAISRDTKLKKVMTIYLIFSMMFSGGMIPTYMVLNSIGLVGSRAAIIVQEATMGMMIIIGANAFRGVPESTVQSARIDGAGHLRTMFQVMLPQCIPLFMVTILNTFVGSWNSWLTASIYVPSDRSKWPIQLVINDLVNRNANFLETANPNYSRYLIRFAIIIAATLPILIAFPFFQKQIEAGVIQGAVKE